MLLINGTPFNDFIAQVLCHEGLVHEADGTPFSTRTRVQCILNLQAVADAIPPRDGKESIEIFGNALQSYFGACGGKTDFYLSEGVDLNDLRRPFSSKGKMVLNFLKRQTRQMSSCF